MWNRQSLFLQLKIRIRGEKPRIRISARMALFVFYQLLLSCEGIFSLIPGRAGRMARGWIDMVYALMLGVMESEPQSYVDVDVEHGPKKILVKLRTIGLWGGNPKC